MRIAAFEIADDVPELHNTLAIVMLRPWVDVGKVGTLVLTKLERHLVAKELGRLARPGNFLDFTRERPRTRIVEGRRVLTLPNSVAHYARGGETGRDYLLLHLREPHMQGEDYADAIVALLDHFNVTEYCRIGAMYDSVPHTRPLQVTATLTEAQEELTRDLVSMRRNTYQGPTSIVNLVNESLDDLGVQSISLMLHLPQYVQLDEDHMGAARVMEVLCVLYGFPLSLADTARGQRQYDEIARAAERNPAVAKLIKDLESEYDQLRARQEPGQESEKEELSMPAELEKFLRELENGKPDQEE
jgi:pyridoxine 5'-phosphate synthase PdxJ